MAARDYQIEHFRDSHGGLGLAGGPAEPLRACAGGASERGCDITAAPLLTASCQSADAPGREVVDLSAIQTPPPCVTALPSLYLRPSSRNVPRYFNSGRRSSSTTRADYQSAILSDRRPRIGLLV
jgi:hypothetical protein